MSPLEYWTSQHPTILSFSWTSAWASSWNFLYIAVASYLVVTALLYLLMKARRTPVPLGPIPALHNLLLLTLSAIMLVGCAYATMQELLDRSAGSLRRSTLDYTYTFCFPLGIEPRGRVFFWSYIFYLSKIYEFTDTFIIILKKRPLTFLHVYHHAVVLLMCFLWLQYSQSLQVIAILTNSSVHTLMYSYYFLCSVGFHPPWKRVVTDCQIVQFLFSFLASFVFLWLHFGGEGCSGFRAWVFNAVFNSTLLILFLNFHKRQYKRARKGD